MSTMKPNETVEADDETDATSVAETATWIEQPGITSRIELSGSTGMNEADTYARHRSHRRFGLALGVLGLLILAGGFVFPVERTVFVALGAIGLYGAILTYYLAPGQFIAAAVGEQIYGTSADNWAALTSALNLHSARIYMPGAEDRSARLFVPRYTNDKLPTSDGTKLVLDREDEPDGLVLEPVGARLVQNIESTLTEEFAQEPASLATQLCDGIVEQLELASRATPKFDPDGNQVTVAVSGSTFGNLDQFDHPIPSVLATGLATGLEQSVQVDVTSDDSRAEWLVTCQLHADRSDPAEDATEE